jgi:hypothetical protein
MAYFHSYLRPDTQHSKGIQVESTQLVNKTESYKG